MNTSKVKPASQPQVSGTIDGWQQKRPGHMQNAHGTDLSVRIRSPAVYGGHPGKRACVMAAERDRRNATQTRYQSSRADAPADAADAELPVRIGSPAPHTAAVEQHARVRHLPEVR
jgi:hypothetical protein